MEPGACAAWGPSERQPANWGIEQEPAAEVYWAPAAGLPMEYACAPMDIFGSTCSLQAYVPPHEYSGGQQQAEHYFYSAASRPVGAGNSTSSFVPPWNPGNQHQQQPPPVVHQDPQNNGGTTKTPSVEDVFNRVSGEFNDHINQMKEKMHRFPACLQEVEACYRTPRIVAIGPYHHDEEKLKQTEMVKHVAAIHCVGERQDKTEELYGQVALAADHARCLYDKDVMKNISYVDFRHMMFFDACFLVQYMLMWTEENIDERLSGFFRPNSRDIRHDVMLLENQIPWEVVKPVIRFAPQRLKLKHFIYILKGYLQHRRPSGSEDTASSEIREPPHLLGLLRHLSVGGGGGSCDDDLCSCRAVKENMEAPRPKHRSISIGATELEQIGIKLTANKETTELIHMALHPAGNLLHVDLSLPPLSLDRNRATYLVNMAALELCTVKSFTAAAVHDSAACSYLLILAMLVNREEDVQVLRSTGLLQGGGGLNDTQALSFFTSLQGLRLGICYNHVMRHIESYKDKSWMRTKLYAFLYKNWKIITGAVAAFGSVGTIIGTLQSIKKAL